MKNYNREKAGEKILDWWLAEKRGAFFRQGELRKMYGKEAKKKAGKRIFGLMTGRKKGWIFSAKGIEKMYGYEAAEKKKSKKDLMQN